jgi:hypothetical protein
VLGGSWRVVLLLFPADVASEIAAGAVGAVLGAIFTAGGTWWVSVRLDRQRENRVLIGAIAVVAQELEENQQRITRGNRLTLQDWANNKVAMSGLELRDPSLWKKVVETYGKIYQNDPLPPEELETLRLRLKQEQERLRHEIYAFSSPAPPQPRDRMRASGGGA